MKRDGQRHIALFPEAAELTAGIDEDAPETRRQLGPSHGSEAKIVLKEPRNRPQ